MAYYGREYRGRGLHREYDFDYDEDYDYEFGGRGYAESQRAFERGMRTYPRWPRSYEIGPEWRRAYRGYEIRPYAYRARPGYGATRYAYGARRLREARDYDLDFPGPEQVHYGHTPADRWPDVGHDLDHPLPGEARMTDYDIQEAVLENLFADSWIDPQRIDVSVDNGIVTLRGEVADFMEARYAWDDAWETMGVRGVINHLTVRTDLPSPELALPQTAGGSRRRGSGRARPGIAARPPRPYQEW